MTKPEWIRNASKSYNSSKTKRTKYNLFSYTRLNSLTKYCSRSHNRLGWVSYAIIFPITMNNIWDSLRTQQQSELIFFELLNSTYFILKHKYALKRIDLRYRSALFPIISQVFRLINVKEVLILSLIVLFIEFYHFVVVFPKLSIKQLKKISKFS